METGKQIFKEWTILDVAISIGVVAVFTAVAVPLVRGAILRRQTAECAEKVLWAADAFDLYAARAGEYPPDSEPVGAFYPCREMNQTFYDMNIRWWGDKTELGGFWDWFRGDRTGYIAISNPRVSERSMRQLDRLIDDGNLDAGAFRRYGPIYCYILKMRG